METLNAKQSTEIFNLAAECQALSTELAKQFQTLSGLAAIHHAAAQATAHETINAGQMAQNAAYSVLPDDQTQDKKCEETLQQPWLRPTKLGRTPRTWCSTISCVMMDN